MVWASSSEPAARPNNSPTPSWRQRRDLIRYPRSTDLPPSSWIATPEGSVAGTQGDQIESTKASARGELVRAVTGGCVLDPRRSRGHHLPGRMSEANEILRSYVRLVARLSGAA